MSLSFKPKLTNNVRLQADIDRCESVLTNKQNSIDRDFASVKKELRSWRKEFDKAKESRDLPKLKKLQEKRDLLKLRVESLEGEVEQFQGELKKQRNLYDQVTHEKYERMHGLLAYGIASGQTSPDCRLLYNTLGDFLAAKSASDRAAAGRAVNLILAHGDVFGEKQDKTATAEDEIARQFEAMEDGEARTAFYNKHSAEIHRAFDARKNNP